MPSPAQITPNPGMVASCSDIVDFIPLLASIFRNKIAPNVAANMPKYPPLYYFTLFSTVSLTPFINKPASLRDVTIAMLSNSSSENVNVVMPDQKKFF